MDALLDEVESLEAILMDDVRITKNASGFPELIETTIFPTVGEEQNAQYVCITLQVEPVRGYPDVRPLIRLKNPRGLDDHVIGQIEAAVDEKLAESVGQPVVFDLIDIIRERLTESNRPSGQCVICLYGFLDGDEFTKTVCYHYLHSHCLACHINASRRNYEEERDKLPVWKQKEAKPFQAQCPVCRESIEVEVEPLMGCRPPVERESAPRFQVTDELKTLQARMARLYLHQKSRGGIIDPEAEETPVIAIQTEAANGESPKNTADITAAVSVAPEPVRNSNAPSHQAGKGKQHTSTGNKNSSGKGGGAKGGPNRHSTVVAAAASSSSSSSSSFSSSANQSHANGTEEDNTALCSDPTCIGAQVEQQRGHRNRRHNNHHHHHSNRHARHSQQHHYHHHHHHQQQHHESVFPFISTFQSSNLLQTTIAYHACQTRTSKDYTGGNSG
ncbi:E3 ubiquitin-protein ligase RNF25 isoform X2 [Anopheles aquasalis]|uniref:E3 ubiquitin-protein ligase RNF25 isoform X2 n=1 Tax=Anopheles aquasalis TaxID=42839 RepID=UPI00215A8ADC|nr:E3 ubiquitin-protein ligase RNF25 isoform X2 [Anopheles aquasalis]